MAAEITVDRVRERVARSMGWRRPEDWPSEVEPVEIANEAGHWLYSFDWNCLSRAPALLSIVAGQTWIDLPADFGAMVGDKITTTTGYGHSLRLATMVQVRDARAVQPGGNALSYTGAIVHTGPTVAGPRSYARIELGPVPSNAASDVFLLTYKAGWVEVSDGSDHILVPSWMQSVYIAAATAFVGGREQESGGTVEDRLDRLAASSLFGAVRSRDLSIQTELGIMRGGVGETLGMEGEPFVTSTYVPIVGSNA
jgi:hypothetical protein